MLNLVCLAQDCLTVPILGDREHAYLCLELFVDENGQADQCLHVFKTIAVEQLSECVIEKDDFKPVIAIQIVALLADKAIINARVGQRTLTADTQRFTRTHAALFVLVADVLLVSTRLLA